MSIEKRFLHFQAQTSPYPFLIQTKKARGVYIYDNQGKRYIDLVAGVSACPLGHCHPVVVKAIQRQSRAYLHVMVYGELIQRPQLDYCQLLASHLPSSLQSVYLTNSGTEAIEGALKLAKRYTGRTRIVACEGAYHGSTHGSLSVTGPHPQKEAYRPLLPDVHFMKFNDQSTVEMINEQTACVIMETIQGGAGFIIPQQEFMTAVRERCDEVGALLILDEIQPGFGRTGRLFGFQHFGITPDILVIGKAMAGGLPAGAFVSSKEKMNVLKDNPKLGHITTFGGHPLIAAAAKATLKHLIKKRVVQSVTSKENIVRQELKHSAILEIRGMGLMLALRFESAEVCQQVVHRCLDLGVITFFLLFRADIMRITPPLTITENELRKGVKLVLQAIRDVCGHQ